MFIDPSSHVFTNHLKKKGITKSFCLNEASSPPLWRRKQFEWLNFLRPLEFFFSIFFLDFFWSLVCLWIYPLHPHLNSFLFYFKEKLSEIWDPFYIDCPLSSQSLVSQISPHFLIDSFFQTDIEYVIFYWMFHCLLNLPHCMLFW